MRIRKESSSIRWYIFRQHSILTTLSLLVLSTLVTLVLVRFYLQNETTTQKRESAMISGNISLIIDNAVEETIKLSVEQRLQSTLIEYDIASQTERALLQSTLNSLVTYSLGLDNTISFCCIADTEGNLITSTPYNSSVQALLDNSDLYRQILSKEAVQLFGPFSFSNRWLPTNEKNMLLISKPITQLGASTHLGTLLVFVSENHLCDIYTQNAPSPETQIFLSDSSGKIISSTQKDAIYCNFSEYFTPSNSIGSTTVFTDNSQHYLIYETVLAEYGWTLSCAIPLTIITNQILKLFIITFLISLAMVCIMLVLSLHQSSRITRPIISLTEIMNSITKGNNNIRASVTGSDEIALLCSGFNQLMDTQEQLIHHVKEEQDLNSHYRFRLLQEQVKPHFLYNALESIMSLVQLDMKQEAESALFQLADFYRLSLSNGDDIIPLEQELRLTEDYLAIQKTRYVEFFDYGIHIDCPLDAYCIPKLTLQPLVENAIYHGIKPKRSFGHIQVSITSAEDHLKIVVEDNGIGMSQERIQSLLHGNEGDKNFGLASIIARLHYLFNSPNSLTIESVPGEFTKITIKLTTKEAAV